MKTIFSPFNGIIETALYPHARTLRTSFAQKCKDTFFVLFGKISLKNKSIQLGLVDYLTLGLLIIPFYCVADALFGKHYSFEEKILAFLLIAFVFSPILLLAGFLRFVVTPITAAALTVCVSPIIAVVHLISRLFAYKEHQLIQAIQVTSPIAPQATFFLSDVLENILPSESAELTQVRSQNYTLSSKGAYSEERLRFFLTLNQLQVDAVQRLNIGGIQAQREGMRIA